MSDAPADPPVSPRRIGVVPLWHLVPIALVLVVSSFFVGHDGYVFIDEAALLAQVDLVADGEWVTDRPLADADPDGAYAPMARSTVTDDGFAPFPNHPLHVLVAAAADGVGGDVGVRMLSVLGAVGAAAAAGWLGATRSRLHGAVSMWVAGLASPLVFDANLVVAHTVAAAFTGAALVVAFRAGSRSGSARTDVIVALGVGALITAGGLLRSEVVLLGAAIGVVAGLRGFLGRSRRGVLVGSAAFSAAVGVYVLEPLWIDRLVGESPGQKVIAASSRGGVSGAKEGALTVLFGRGEAGMAVVLAVLLACAAVVALRLRPSDAGLAAVLAGGGVVAAATSLADPRVIPGIVLAFPLLTAGALAAGTRQVWPTAIRRSGEAAGLFALVVLATQYSVGGGAEWGWRYVAVALPAVCAGLSIPLVALARSPARPARIALAGVVLVGLLVPLGGVVAQRRTVERVAKLLDRTDAGFASTGADVIVAADSSFGRYVWPRSLDGDVVTVRTGVDELDQLLGFLAVRGVDQFLLVWVGSEPAVPLERASPDGEVISLLEGTYDARAYDLVPNTRSPS